MDNVQIQKRPYLGKPQNQKDPQALLPEGRQPTPEAVGTKPKVRPKRQLPKTINPPTRLAANMSKDIQLTVDDPAKNAIFVASMSVREVNNDTRFEPACPTLLEVARLCYAEYVADDINTQKAILPEYLDYYATAMLWLRLISLKVKLRQPLTIAERDALLLIENSQFSIPEPIMIQLKSIGSVQTMTREHLTPSIPDLPQEVIAGHGGYYGPITVDTHNLYEEIPCLGVTSEAVRQSVSNAAPGPYVSSLAGDNIEPNQNLLGFRPLANRRNEAKNIAFDAGITQDAFPEYPPNTGLNMNLLYAVSAYLGQTKTFRLSSMSIDSLPESGSLMQALIQRPESPTNQHVLEKLEDIAVTSMMNEQLSITGAAIMYCPQLLKRSSTLPLARTWCCINAPPQPWLNNRNARRTIPERYQSDVFRSITQNGRQYRMATMRQMILTKR